MRRGRGKGKKQNASTRESGEEEKTPAYRRRGRPQKLMKDEFEEEEEEEETVEKIEDEEDIDDGSVTSKKEKKRKISNGSNVNEEETRSSSTGDSMKLMTSNGFRQNGSRRKSKPRRAAEAVVECNGV